ncbi:MAG: hypothetical protein LUG16_03415 [Candidatus Gastranaerophilales bacterium]|nr:hypothetical protein [Candidatus Gastranaerophilales bacterium]
MTDTMKRYNEEMPKLHYEQIPIKNLTAEQTYQRKLSIQHIKKAVANFNPYQINPVKVSRRNGINYVVNGQHTIEILATYFNSREIPVWCIIYDNLDYTKEADLFANQQKYVKSLTPYEIFIANIEAGNDEQILIKDIVEKYGLFLSPSKVSGGICAISTLEDIFYKHGYQILDSTLRLCIATWEGEENSLSSNMLKGIARLVATYNKELDEQLFKEKLGLYSIKEITRTAADRRAGSLGFAEAILLFYNKKLKMPIDMSRLYKQRSSNNLLDLYRNGRT